MSYTSESKLSEGTKLGQVREVVSLLGYEKVSDGLKVPDRTDSFFWYGKKDYRSYVGVELDIYRTDSGAITASTRSRLGRSYWDLVHQNKTLKMLRDLFGGNFTTDAGQNRYWRPEEAPPSPLASGCFIARWRFNNALIRGRIYLNHRRLDVPIARETPSGLAFMDEMNPRVLSNNMLLPYAVAVWEDYFRSTFSAILSHSSKRGSALKKARLSQSHLEQVALGAQPERVVAETLSFQRPTAIAENFRLMDPKIDIAGALRAPFRNRKISLFEAIEDMVERRNEFVHAGRLSVSLFDKQIKRCLSDLEAAVDRSYSHLGDVLNFVPSRDY